MADAAAYSVHLKLLKFIAYILLPTLYKLRQTE